MSNNLPPLKQDNLRPTLCSLQVGETCVVVDVDSRCEAFERLTELGFTPGAEVTLVAVAPLGDPLETEIRGYRLCLRKDTARYVYVRDRTAATTDK